MAKKSTSKTKSIHPHIRVTDAKQIALLEKLKQETDEKTFSGALMNAAASYFTLKGMLSENGKVIHKLQTQLQAANDVINSQVRTKTLLDSYSKAFKVQPGRHEQISMPYDMENDID